MLGSTCVRVAAGCLILSAANRSQAILCLRELWLHATRVFDPRDRSGVWRFREFLPFLTTQQSFHLAKETRRFTTRHVPPITAGFLS